MFNGHFAELSDGSEKHVNEIIVVSHSCYKEAKALAEVIEFQCFIETRAHKH